jgi:acetyltransferase-like isoleucine patch superfamily enzyme
VRGSFKLKGPGAIVIGDDVIFDGLPGSSVSAANGGTVTIGRGCYITNGVFTASAAPLLIGEDCLIGDCLIATSAFHSVARNRRSPNAAIRSAPIVVGRNVWLANRTAVLPGVTIGDDSVIALGTVVTKDVPAGVVVAGQRMRIVKELDPS